MTKENAPSGLRRLIGRRVSIVFNLPSYEWPIPGYPAHATVRYADGPLLLLDELWVNVSLIKTISDDGPDPCARAAAGGT